MTAIIDIHAREILDSRGNPTVEVDVTLESGAIGRAAVPSGASTGAHEAVELRDGDKARYGGKGVRKAVDAVNGEIFDALSGFDAEDQVAIDRLLIELDGTPNKARLGANAILGVSLAGAKAAAIELDAAALPLCRRRLRPHPAGADDEHRQWRRPCRQPDRHPGIHDHAGRRRQRRRGDPHRRRDLPRAAQAAEGRRAQHQCRRRGRLRAEPRLGRRGARLRHAGDRERPATSPGEDVVLALDAAATEFYKDGKYELEGEGKTLDAAGMVALSRRSRRALSDRLDRGRHGRGRLGRLGGADARRSATRSSSSATISSSPTRSGSREGIERGVANSILVKVNQIGTLSETLEAVEMAHRAGYTAVMSHRSGETEDATIADLAVATNCGQIKTGSLSRSDRLAKYNQLIRIEEQLGDCRALRRAGRAAPRAEPRIVRDH